MILNGWVEHVFPSRLRFNISPLTFRRAWARWSQTASWSRTSSRLLLDQPDLPGRVCLIRRQGLSLKLKACTWINAGFVTAAVPRLPTTGEWPRNPHPTTESQTPQRSYCWFRNPFSAQSAACAKGGEDWTVSHGAFLSTLLEAHKCRGGMEWVE